MGKTELFAQPIDKSQYRNIIEMLRLAKKEKRFAEAILFSVDGAEREAGIHLAHSWKLVAELLSSEIADRKPFSIRELQLMFGCILPRADGTELALFSRSLIKLIHSCSSDFNLSGKDSIPDYSELLSHCRWIDKVISRVQRNAKDRYGKLSIRTIGKWPRLALALGVCTVLYVSVSLLFGVWNPKFWRRHRIDNIYVMNCSKEWGVLRINKSVLGNKLCIGRREYQKGIGTHAYSEVKIGFSKKHETFSGACGVDSEVGSEGLVIFRIVSGNRELYRSPLMRGGDPADNFKVSVDAMDNLLLVVDDVGDEDFDHADWVDLHLDR